MLSQLLYREIMINIHVLFPTDHDLFKYEYSYEFRNREICLS